jgi:hypothetical protein
MQASGCLELMLCDQSFFKLQLAFPHPHEGLNTETPWAGHWGQRWELFFFILFLKLLSTFGLA